jgi:hypothetical protein
MRAALLRRRWRYVRCGCHPQPEFLVPTAEQDAERIAPGPSDLLADRRLHPISMNFGALRLFRAVWCRNEEDCSYESLGAVPGNSSPRGPFWVNRVDSTMSASGPLMPWKQRKSRLRGRSRIESGNLNPRV